MNVGKAIVAISVFALLMVSLLFFAYTVWNSNRLLKSAGTEGLSEVQIAENRDKLVNALTGVAGVSANDIYRGFWYRFVDENGLEQVAFMDVNELSRKDLTQWQIDNIAGIVRKSDIKQKDALSVVNISDMPDEYRFHNELYKVEKDGSFLDIKSVLEQKIRDNKYGKDDLFRLGYIYELEGKYDLRDELYEKSCKEFGVRCGSDFTIVARGRVIDLDGDPVASARVSVLSASGDDERYSVETDENGFYSIEFPVRKMEKIRIKAVKRNYSDGIANSVVITSGKKEHVMDDIVLASPLKVVTLNTVSKTVSGSENKYDSNKRAFIIKTPQSEYTIPDDSIVRYDGSVYEGAVDVYLYEFSRDTAPESLLAVDTMDQVMGYAGDLMKSFGMPYIQFFATDGEELHVLRSKPMRIRYTIYHMDKLRNNEDGIYTALTDEDMEMLVQDSSFGGYPINREYLIENNMLQFPAFWVFDRSVGIWENVGVNVLNTDGLIESIFYTINDMREASLP